MARWVEVSLVVPRGRAEAAGAVLVGLGAGGFQEDFLPGEAPPPRQPWETGPPAPLPGRVVVRAWWPEPAWPAEAACAALEGAALPEPTVTVIDDEPWATAWQAGFRPVQVSDRLVVSPPWAAAPGDLVIEPGMAFGTGEHPSTRACLEAVDRLAIPGGTCLDVGTGTGVLALCAARLGMRARAVDTDADAVRAAVENAARNGLLLEVDGAPLSALREPFDLVVANLFAEVLIDLAPDLARLTGGYLVLAGILADREERVAAAFPALSASGRRGDGEWVSLEYRR